MGFCKDCAQWRPTTYDPANRQIGVCQIDGKEKDDIRHSCVFFEKKRVTTGALNLGGRKE